ncbi:MAG: class I SAM-dependent methyltransferase [Litoreibacter sp.]|nr:class I SAM-dependent methyltransferase [Litoreibacter sp.]
MDKKFLDEAYDVSGADQTIGLYDEWSASYDAEVAENGYITPSRVAAALARVIEDLSAPVLDYGCGTGLSGLALRAAGFSVIDGADPSPEMLKQAEAKSAYRNLTLLDLDANPPFAPGQYPTITAIGVIGAGAAPIEVFDLLMDLLTPGGRLALSLNDHALEIPEFPARITTARDTGAAHVLVEEYGDHLPGIGLKSMIYVLEKK